MSIIVVLQITSVYCVPNINVNDNCCVCTAWEEDGEEEKYGQ